jgi:predicted MFS family arabinose efflux permease
LSTRTALTVDRTSAAPSIEPTNPRWAAVWALSLGVASLSTAEMLPMSLLTPMAGSLSISVGTAGQAITASAVVAIVTSLVIAPLIRGMDRRRVLLALSAAQILSNLAVALAPSVLPLLLARLVLGIAVGGFWGLSASLALRLVPKPDLAKALSIIFGGGAVATIAAAPLGAFLGAHIGWRGVFVAAAVLALAAYLGQARTLPAMPATATTGLSGLWHTLRLRQIAAGMLGVMLLFGGRQMFATYLRPFLEHVTHFTVTGVSVTLLVLGVASFAGTTAAAPLLQRNLRLTLTVLAGVQAVLAVLFVALGAVPAAVLALTALWGVAAGMVPVGWSTWLTRTIPDRAESGGGILVAAIQGSMMIGALTGGVIIDTAGATGPVTASAVILALGAVHTATALRPRRNA